MERISRISAYRFLFCALVETEEVGSQGSGSWQQQSAEVGIAVQEHATWGVPLNVK